MKRKTFSDEIGLSRMFSVYCLVIAGVLLSITSTLLAAPLPKVVIVATGGTIAMKVDQKTGALVPAVKGEDLVASVPGLKKIADIEVVEFSNIPSDDYTLAKWAELSKTVSSILARPEVSGVIVTQGLDAMEETAFFLDVTITSNKPVICTGAKRDASQWDSDGPRNILNSVRIAISPDAVGHGAMVCLNSQINAAREVYDTSKERYESFSSGQSGFLGYADDDRIWFARKSLLRQTLPLKETLPSVDIVPMYGGADGKFIDAAVQAGTKGIVVVANGVGNVSALMYDAIKRARDKGIPIVVSSWVPNGRVRAKYGFKGGSKTLADLGAVFANDLNPKKARILLALALGVTADSSQLQNIFNK
jgi:L-asparaginase